MSVDQFLLSADTTDLNYPEIRPTLDLNFARVKALDPRITFTRSSGGSYVGADGLIKYAGVNEARFDHDPETGESLGLLIEESRTNLLLQSENFSTSWDRNQITAFGSGSAINAIAAPDGSQTADLITVVNGQFFGVTGFISQGITKAAVATAYTLSVFVKKQQQLDSTQLILHDAANLTNRGAVIASLATGTITSTINSGTFSSASSTITALANDWYRLTLTVTSSTETALRSRIYPRDSVATTSDGTSGIYVWGAQLEVGAFPTSYIPTQASTRTRAADNASITGKNFSEWYRQDEGTVLVGTRVQSHVQSNFPRLFSIDDGTLFNFLSVVRGFNIRRIDYSVWNSGIGQAVGLNNGILPQVNSNIKAAIIYKRNEFTGANVGVQINSDTSGNVPIVTSLNIGMRGQSGLHYNGTISRLTYFPKRLPNAQLQALTR
jgi:hypothetical protein